MTSCEYERGIHNCPTAEPTSEVSSPANPHKVGSGVGGGGDAIDDG